MHQHEPRDCDPQKKPDHLERLLLEGINSGEMTEMTRDDWQGIIEKEEHLVSQRKAGRG